MVAPPSGTISLHADMPTDTYQSSLSALDALGHRKHEQYVELCTDYLFEKQGQSRCRDRADAAVVVVVFVAGSGGEWWW